MILDLWTRRFTDWGCVQGGLGCTPHPPAPGDETSTPTLRSSSLGLLSGSFVLINACPPNSAHRLYGHRMVCMISRRAFGCRNTRPEYLLPPNGSGLGGQRSGATVTCRSRNLPEDEKKNLPRGPPWLGCNNRSRGTRVT